MNKIIRFVISLILVTTLLSACSTLYSLFGRVNIKEPQVEFIDAKLTGLSFDAVDFMFNLKVQNPNPLGVKLAGFDYDFLINGASFLKGKQEKEIEIKAKGENTIELPLSLDFIDLYNAFQNLRNQEESRYQLNCVFSFNLPVLGVVKVPVSKKGEFPLLKRPEINLDALRIKSLNLSGAELQLGIKLNNPNTFSMTLNHFQYNLEINEQSWISGDTKKNIKLPKKGESIIEITISLDFFQIGKSVYQVLTEGKSLDYRFEGNLDFTTSIPLLSQLKLPFNRSGKIEVIK